jgi:hypothetical protein
VPPILRATASASDGAPRRATRARSGGDTPGMRSVAIALVSAALIVGCGGGSSTSSSDRDKAVSEAQAAFRQAQARGQDLSTGPCISESLRGLPDWAVDVAHEPRQAVDDVLANQCASYRSGQTHHFVELTPDGQLIRAQ